MLLRCGQTVRTAAAVRQLFPLVPWLTCATKQARVRNQESTSWANHFNKHLPTKRRLKWEQHTVYFIWHAPLFLLSGTLIWLRQNRHVGLCDWKITFLIWSSYPEFLCAFMTRYYFPCIAILNSGQHQNSCTDGGRKEQELVVSCHSINRSFKFICHM